MSEMIRVIDSTEEISALATELVRPLIGRRSLRVQFCMGSRPGLPLWASGKPLIYRVFNSCACG